MNFGRKGGAGSKQRRKEKRNYIAKWQKGNEIMAKREANTIDKAVEKCMEKEPTEIKKLSVLWRTHIVCMQKHSIGIGGVRKVRM